MKKDGGSESTIIVGPSKSVLVYAIHSLEYVLGLARFSGVRAKLTRDLLDPMAEFVRWCPYHELEPHKFLHKRVTRYISGLAYFWCCQVKSDISIGKFDILYHNRTRNVLTYDRNLCCLK